MMHDAPICGIGQKSGCGHIIGIICTFMGDSIHAWHGAWEKFDPNRRALQQTDLVILDRALFSSIVFTHVC
jgi:hypothetical protein